LAKLAVEGLVNKFKSEDSKKKEIKILEVIIEIHVKLEKLNSELNGDKYGFHGICSDINLNYILVLVILFIGNAHN